MRKENITKIVGVDMCLRALHTHTQKDSNFRQSLSHTIGMKIEEGIYLQEIYSR